jgi:hypothetical protein
MAAKSVTSKVLSKAFNTALLLTGSVEQSEAAVLESIRCLDLDEDEPGEKLIRGALKVAITRHREIVAQRPENLDDSLPALPPELRRVLRLSPDLRQCFALRILAGLPRNICARLLDLEFYDVDEITGLAAQRLASIAGEEQSRQAAVNFG